MPKISVIVPCYNPDKALFNECIDSILNQDFTDFELIIVNDGSDEKYSEYIKMIAEKDKRIVLITQKNKGVSAARNLALDIAKGEYISFVDDDDIVLPYYLSEAYNIAKKNKSDFVAGAVIRTSNRKLKLERNYDCVIDIYDAVDKIKLSFLYPILHFSEGGYLNRGPVAKLIKKNIIDKIRFDTDIKVGEDKLFNMSVLENAHKVCIVHQVWYLYYKNQKSVTLKYNENIALECEKYLLKIKRYLNLKNNQEYICYIDLIWESIRYHIYNQFLKYLSFDINYIKTSNAIYTREPWNYVIDSRYRKLVSFKKKVWSLLFKYKLYFLVKDIRAKLKNRGH